MANAPYTSYQEKFERLLELFPHPDRRDYEDPEKRKWRMYELVAGSNGELSAGYLSALRRGKNKRPGMYYLDLIANLIGFPFELWLTEPEQWPGIIAENSAGDANGFVPEQDASTESYAQLVETLFVTVTNRKTGRGFTNAEVAERTRGVLRESDIEELRDGTFDRPSQGELIALSNAFGIDVSYWFSSSNNSPMLDEGLQDVLQARQDERRYEMLRKSFGVTDKQVDILLNLLEDWQEESKGRGQH